MTAQYFVGIDVARDSHSVAVVGPDGERVGVSFSVKANPQGLTRLVRTLRERGVQPSQTQVGLEASGHLWENLEAFLTKKGYCVRVLNPLQLRRFRDVMRTKAKTDDLDAYLIAGLLRSGQAQSSYVPDEQIQSLRELARLRARLLSERQDYLRRLQALLAVVFPEHRGLLGRLTGVRAQALLKAFPTACHLAGASPQEILKVARAAGARGFTASEAARLHQAAAQSIYSGKALAARAQVVRTLLTQIERLSASLKELDAAMEDLLPPPQEGAGPTDAQLLQSIPGIGPQTAAALLGELGDLRRFHSAKALVAYVGFYPRIEQSGRRERPPRLAKAGSPVARHALYMAAVNAMRRSPQLRTIYLRKRSQGKSAKQALIVVAVKLLHTAYALVRERAHFDPSRLLVAPEVLRT
jgi:transposase